jgi:hypothetical protein
MGLHPRGSRSGGRPHLPHAKPMGASIVSHTPAPRQKHRAVMIMIMIITTIFVTVIIIIISSSSSSNNSPPRWRLDSPQKHSPVGYMIQSCSL